MSPHAPTLDLVGVGVGPFNLGLAALLEPVSGVRAEFLDRGREFTWHPGLMLEGAEIQVPFLADLVTLADPTSQWSFLNYLHAKGRLYRFYFYEHAHALRREFQDYCAWVAGQLPQLAFGQDVTAVDLQSDGTWRIDATDLNGAVTTRVARHVALGVGTAPSVPACAQGALGGHGAPVLHSSDYLTHREALQQAGTVTVIGSGQSAAEIVLDLIENGPHELQIDWYSRSPGFLAMEYSKLGLETFSPEYTQHFRGLPARQRDDRRGGQNLLYKGISLATSEAIYDALYRRSLDGEPPVDYRAGCELLAVESGAGGAGLQLELRHLDEGTTFTRRSGGLVLATGYAAAELQLTEATRQQLATDAAGRPDVSSDYRLLLADGTPTTAFVQNAELHTHGVGTPDLGLGTHRNAVIINGFLGREQYAVRDRNVFQRFGSPDEQEPGRAAGASRPTLRRIA